MKKYCNLYSLLAAFAILLSACQQEQKAETVKIRLKAGVNPPAGFKINTTDILSFEPSLLAEASLDSSGFGIVEFKLDKPILAYLEIGEESRSAIYLTPGDDLELSYSSPEPEQPIIYSGKGAAANNYLAQSLKLKSAFETAGGIFIFNLPPEAYVSRHDSLTNALAKFHRQYTDSLAIPETAANLLERRNNIELLSMKMNFAMMHRDNPDLPQALKEPGKEIPFDISYLEEGITEYGWLLHMHLDELYAPYLANKSTEEIEAIKNTLPALVDQDIRKGAYPADIKEYLRARNLNFRMEMRGITPTLDTLFNNYKQALSSSPYLPALEKTYQSWLAISPGKPAPDFSGTSPEGKTVALSQFKGKVVYVDVWATWCGPCRREIPHAKALQKKFEGNQEVVFLYASVDDNSDAWKKMLADDPTFTGTHMIGEGGWETSLVKDYLIKGIPRYILIDQEGKIVQVSASRPSSGKVEQEIQALLAKKKLATR